METNKEDILLYFFDKIKNSVYVDFSVLDYDFSSELQSDFLKSSFSKISVFPKNPVISFDNSPEYNVVFGNNYGVYLSHIDKIIIRNDSNNNKKNYLVGIHELTERELLKFYFSNILYSKKENKLFESKQILKEKNDAVSHNISLSVNTLFAENIYKTNKHSDILDINMNLISDSNYIPNSFISKYIENREKTLKEYDFKF